MGFEFDHQNIDKIHIELCQDKRDRKLSADGKLIFNYISWFSMLRKGEMILNAYKEQILPRIKRIIGIQKYFSVKNDVSTPQ